MQTLQKIREMYDGKPDAKACPQCKHALTIEKTKYFETRLCENCFEHSEIIHFEDCCSNPDTSHVRFITAGATIQIRNQCNNCGKLYPKSLGGFTQTAKDAMPVADIPLKEEYQKILDRAYTESFKRKAQGRAKLNEDHRMDWWSQYTRYLQSPEWKNKRALVLKRDEYKCQACLEGYATQVHHKSYDFVDMKGNEPAFDLVAVCVPCHDKIEARKKELKGK